MQVLSSDSQFNELIHSIKGSARKLSAVKGEASYMFMMAENKKKNDFMKHLQGFAIDDDQIVDEDGNVYVPDDENEGGEQDAEEGDNNSESEQTENETDTENAE